VRLETPLATPASQEQKWEETVMWVYMGIRCVTW
jgi:hypothetical protein